MNLMNTKTLNECFFQIRNGANIKQGVVDGGFPITRIETIANDKFNRDRMGYAGIYELDKYKDYVLEDGDLLMSHINSVKYLGRTVIYKKQDDETIIHGMNLLSLKAKRDIITPDYAYYFFYSNYFRSQISNITKKSVNQASFSISDLKRLYILVPTLNQQHKIVSILDQVNDLISLRNQQLEQLDLLIKSRFVEMFGDETNSKNLPITDIEKIANVSVGIVVKPSQYYTDENTGIKAFRSLNVDIMNIKDKDWVYITKEGNELNKKSILHENDVLIVRSGYPGTSCVVTKEYEGCNAIDVIIAHPDLRKVNAYYLAMYTNLPHGMNQIKRGSGGSAQQHFNVGRYNKLHLILPSIELQTQFAAFVEEVDKTKATVKQSLEWLNTLKAKLMQDYFR